MFSSLFYIAILFIQSIYAESNFSYNQQVGEINDLVEKGKFREAYQGIRKLEDNTVFTNNDLARMRRKLELKIPLKPQVEYYTPKTLNEYIIRSLSFYQNRDFSLSLAFCKNIIVNEPIVADSLIKMFEIFSEQAPLEKNSITHQVRQKSIKNIRINEAMNLLDLMKRKEKTLF